ncbi:monofunctional peptidoglycan glycosyltransferase SgtB [Staphylococcus massiliensis]|uniref:Monofunctional glycosyltransferase n=1 Tax=Staphylococcus massiliensis S46 TaxID=1229783 RepID=K9AWA3_9STAP|nr:monofunctional peptidoglycan glycosyltransferase SgtB [Staphylococcus massiliensis]EKU46822.1 glycosyltransferase [Staphylococcus massiliensis S46]MCG3399963.1 monofunctional peptidoglycan glycosyltransferase SgtB [Staphylococcus massiliensis]MCG3402682.1 monofunctional peptidoglycan glycosyltransferase SgtB [Staphylococcus massiliensis]MCG3412929.1 monofunctional peptidoglycan glycosyltransferase SgtB [Staphylococcus massiliensis]POA01562.1 glycosyltransferase [Staphylococcus massiliensis 
MKRSQKYAKSSRAQYDARYDEPYYNTYEHPVGQPPSKKRGMKFLGGIFAVIFILGLIFVGAMYLLSLRADVDELKSLEEKPNFVSSQDMPHYTKGAFIALEDRRFNDHNGFDLRGTFRALFTTVRTQNLQGGSTITQQTVKNYYYDNEQSITRKLKEFFVALRVERKYNKNEILSYYMNNIYYGNNQYDIESAANYYFGATVNQNNPSLPKVTVLQSAILASKINAPSVYDSQEYSPAFINRVKSTLEKMKQEQYINDQQYTEALQQLGV